MESDSKKYIIKIYSADLKEDWIQVLSNSDDTWMFHDLELNLKYAESDNLVNHSFLLYDSSNLKPVALVPLFSHRQNFQKFYRIDKVQADSNYASGPAIIKSLNEKIRREIIQLIGARIEEICVTNSVDICTLGSGNLSKRALSNQFGFTNPWHEFRKSWENKTTVYYYLDLSLPVEKLKSQLEIRTRTVINKFEKETPFVIKEAGPDNYSDLYALYLKTRERTNQPLHSPERLNWFFNYKHACQFIAYTENQPACAINIAIYNDTGLYWNSFTDPDFIKSQIATYLLWYCILEAKKRGVMHFEVGTQEFRNPDSKEDGIAKFKRSFGGALRYKFQMQLTRYNKIQRVLKFISARL
jgi:hypothetical protein